MNGVVVASETVPSACSCDFPPGSGTPERNGNPLPGNRAPLRSISCRVPANSGDVGRVRPFRSSRLIEDLGEFFSRFVVRTGLRLADKVKVKQTLDLMNDQ